MKADVTECSRVTIKYGPLADSVDRKAGGALRDYIFFVVPAKDAERLGEIAHTAMEAAGRAPSDPVVEDVGHRVDGEFWTEDEVRGLLVKMGFLERDN